MIDDWIEVELGEICNHSKGKKPKVLEKSYTVDTPLPYINIKAFEKGIFDEYTDGEKCNICEDGDLLMVWDGARAGFTGRAKKGAIGSTLMKIEPKNEIDKTYMFYYLLSLYTKLNTNPRGVGIPHVEPRLLWNSTFLLPSKTIQRAIVSKIESLFSDLDKGIADLNLAKEQLKIYRQAVLKKAFEGELTKEWREQQTNLPTAEELLKQIKQERQNHYEQQLEEWEQAVKVWEEHGKKGKKLGKPKHLKEISKLKQSENLPKVWLLSNLEQIGYWTGGGTPSKAIKKYWENGHVLWITSKDMKTKYLIDSQNKITKESIDESSAKFIIENSILVVLRSGILRRILPIGINKVQCTVNQDLQALTPFSISPEFIYWYLFSNEFDIRHHCAKDGTTVESVEATLLKQYVISVCSKQEQHQIVREIESRLSVCDKVEQSIAEALEKSEALRQSILKKAFEGKLLSVAEIEKCKQAPDYEPASVLLQRIKQSRTEKVKKE